MLRMIPNQRAKHAYDDPVAFADGKEIYDGTTTKKPRICLNCELNDRTEEVDKMKERSPNHEFLTKYPNYASMAQSELDLKHANKGKCWAERGKYYKEARQTLEASGALEGLSK